MPREQAKDLREVRSLFVRCWHNDGWRRILFHVLLLPAEGAHRPRRALRQVVGCARLVAALDVVAMSIWTELAAEAFLVMNAAGELLRVCPVCGSEFWHKGNKVYCCADCHRQAYGVELVAGCLCRGCGETFDCEITRSHPNRELTVTHCPDCRAAAYTRLQRLRGIESKEKMARRAQERREAREREAAIQGNVRRSRQLAGKRSAVAEPHPQAAKVVHSPAPPPQAIARPVAGIGAEARKPSTPIWGGARVKAEPRTLPAHIRAKVAAEHGYDSWAEYEAARTKRADAAM